MIQPSAIYDNRGVNFIEGGPMLRQGAGAPSVATINQGYPTNNRKAAGDIE